MGKEWQWKANGEEDKFILKLIKQGKVTKFTKPCVLKKTYPETFSMFSSNVMRNHLNTLKRNNGLYLDDLSDDEEEQEKTEEVSQSLADETKSIEATKSTSNLLTQMNYP